MFFYYIGIDYTGQFPLKDRLGRGSKFQKCYICVFVCFCTKAIHQELVLNLATNCFLSCLRRFISRRGLPSNIFSDNGSSFIGARNELRESGEFLFTNQTARIKWCVLDNIHWHFITPYTPNQGGLWEATVKSTKSHLKKMMFNKYFVYEEFYSLIVQIEGI